MYKILFKNFKIILVRKEIFYYFKRKLVYFVINIYSNFVGI